MGVRSPAPVDVDLGESTYTYTNLVHDMGENKVQGLKAAGVKTCCPQALKHDQEDDNY